MNLGLFDIDKLELSDTVPEFVEIRAPSGIADAHFPIHRIVFNKKMIELCKMSTTTEALSSLHIGIMNILSFKSLEDSQNYFINLVKMLASFCISEPAVGGCHTERLFTVIDAEDQEGNVISFDIDS